MAKSQAAGPPPRLESIVDASLRIEMFGSLRVLRGGEEQTRFALQKAAGVLAYLALTSRPQPREHLIDLFWPEMDLPAGRDNLSTTLTSLRRQIEPPGVRRGSVLMATHSVVSLNRAALSTDVADFERFLNRAGEAEGAERLELLKQAIALYRGDLLRELYFDWSVREMERLQARCQDALRSLVEEAQSAGDHDAAIDAARQLLDFDAYAEDTYVLLIKALTDAGQGKRAVETRASFVALFEREFGGPPERHALEEIDRMLDGTRRRPVTAAPGRAKRDESREAAVAPIGPVSAAATRAHAFAPAIFSRFFGREPQMAELGRLLLPQKSSGFDGAPSAPRLVTLLGPGGIGKSRLAIEFARRASAVHGCFCAFVPLFDVDDPSRVADAIASHLRLPPDSRVDALERIADALSAEDRPGGRPILILDNIEQLLPHGDAAELPGESATGAVVRGLLERAPGLAVLCTSRIRLGLRGEAVIAVPPLPSPPDAAAQQDWDLAELAATPSVRLYLDRAQAVRPDFALTATNASAVAALCRLLDGSPLAIELAAAWVRALPPRKMWERLSEGGDIPQGSYADLPERHRSLTATLDWSCRLLSPNLRSLFERCAVFRGGWTEPAAEAICPTSRAAFDLSALQDASLATCAMNSELDEQRYAFQEVVRRYALGRLEASGDIEDARARHSAYFTAFAEDADRHLRGPEQATWLERFEVDHDNFRAALEWQIGPSGSSEKAVRLASSLARFWRVRGHWNEAREWLSRVVACAGPNITDRGALARLLNALGAIEHEQGAYAEARRRYEESLAIRQELGDLPRVADSLHNLGYLALVQGHYEQAGPYYEASLAIQRQLGDTGGIADELHHLGLLAHQQQDVAQARRFYDESLALRRTLADSRGISHTLNNLANIAADSGDLEEGRRLHEESLELRRNLGDKKGIADSLLNLGRLSLRMGRSGEAMTMIREAVRLHHELGDRTWLCQSLDGMAAALMADGSVAAAVRLFAAASASREAIGTGLPVTEEFRDLPADAKAQMSAEAFDLAWSTGISLSPEEAVELAMRPIARSESESAHRTDSKTG